MMYWSSWYNLCARGCWWCSRVRSTAVGCVSRGWNRRGQCSFDCWCCWHDRLGWCVQHQHWWSQGWLWCWCVCVGTFGNEMSLLQLVWGTNELIAIRYDFLVCHTMVVGTHTFFEGSQADTFCLLCMFACSHIMVPMGCIRISFRHSWTPEALGLYCASGQGCLNAAVIERQFSWQQIDIDECAPVTQQRHLQILRIMPGVMLLSLKDNSITGCFYLCHLFYVLSMIICTQHDYNIWLSMYKSEFIYFYIFICCYVYKWCNCMYVSLFAIGCKLCDMSFTGHILLVLCIFVDIT